MADKVIIIGAGIAGLSCGCYLQMNGIQTEILELGRLPGGLCTAWHRGPYVFDGCLRWLMGAQGTSSFNQIWRELGAINGRKVFIHEEMLRIEWPDGRSFAVPSDLDQLAAGLKQLGTEDSALIDVLVRDARRCTSLEPPLEKPLELMNVFEKTRLGLRYFQYAPVVFRYKNMPITQYLERFKSPVLREALQLIVGNKQMSALVLVMLLAFRTRNSTGFVAGGSWDFAMAIADRYEKLGGVIRYDTRVNSIRVEKNRATGVETEGGAVIPARTVISCADGHTTLFKMLQGRFVGRQFRFLYEKCETFPAILQISLGIKSAFPDAPHTLNLPLAEPLRVDDRTTHERFEVETFGGESGLCPQGSTVMTVRVAADYKFWMDLKQQNPQRYRAEKRRIVAAIIAALDQRFPGLAAHLDRTDIATPSTFVRYTGNWQASYEGWLPTPRVLGRRVPCTLPRLRNFFMAGHWVVPGGGLPSAALAGRYVAHIVCAQEGKNFKASVP